MVFLDANIVLETTLKGRSKTEKALQLIADLGGQVAISMLSVHLIMYFGRKDSVDDVVLQEAINQCVLLTFAPEDYDWAVKNEQGRDFEDALQVSVALRSGCDTFVTLDRTLARAYKDAPIKCIAL